ncbi:MAG: hypothetical protein Sylvanvirus39_1 [Sylvanvirus sp.]|uniref:Uncharacterized protein n=1 Tax=Sylvanvirus sp. TaxID=2487774 RepID=A0A3G5AJ94_9VIRU|nr:MAG: hypothetical protein Sylvanvirus39_1 [Sylvanvirus sp.]
MYSQLSTESIEKACENGKEKCDTIEQSRQPPLREKEKENGKEKCDTIGQSRQPRREKEKENQLEKEYSMNAASLQGMDIQVDSLNFQRAFILAERSEHTFAHLLRNRLLEYKGPLGKVKSCGIKHVDEDSEVAILELEVRWNEKKEVYLSDVEDMKPTPIHAKTQVEAKHQFAELLKVIVNQIKKRLGALAFQVDKQGDLITQASTI